MNRALRGIARWALRGFIAFAILAATLFVLAVGLLIWGFANEENDRREPAIQAMKAVGMGEFADAAPYYVLTLPGGRAFHISEYDDHIHNTDLHAALMAHAAKAEGWAVAPVTTDEYAQQIPPEMAFLLPDADLIFDASYHMEDKLAFFDADTGLTVSALPEDAPKPRSVKAAGLSIPTDGWVYEMDTHGGFHGDGDEFLAFAVPEEERPALEAALSAHADWHAGSVTQAEYVRLHRTFYSVPELYPAADVSFDFWYFVDDFARQYPDWESDLHSSELFPAVMQEIGAGCSPNWSVGFYDADTGLLIWYEFDS